MNRQKQIVLPIIGTTTKKQYKSCFMINCRVTDKFINTQFVCTYSLFILPLTKAHTLQLADSSCTVQKITHMAQFHLDINGHQEELWAYITLFANYPIIFKINWLKQYNPAIDWKKKTFNSKYCKETCLRHSLTTFIYSPGYQPKEPLIIPLTTNCHYISAAAFYCMAHKKGWTVTAVSQL